MPSNKIIKNLSKYNLNTIFIGSIKALGALINTNGKMVNSFKPLDPKGHLGDVLRPIPQLMAPRFAIYLGEATSSTKLIEVIIYS